MKNYHSFAFFTDAMPKVGKILNISSFKTSLVPIQYFNMFKAN